jgi:hypothetical protein
MSIEEEPLDFCGLADCCALACSWVELLACVAVLRAVFAVFVADALLSVELVWSFDDFAAARWLDLWR